MSQNHQELSRFSSNGKTFFFNHARAKNGNEYLTVNAIYGQGNKERIIVFEPQMPQFLKNLQRAVQKISGVSVASGEAVTSCPNCGMPKRTWRAITDEQGRWVLYCSECRESCDAFLEDHDEALEVIKNGPAE
jgi:hypothetical protein